MTEFSVTIWIMAVVFFGFVMFIAYPHFLTKFLVYREWTVPKTPSSHLPFRVSILTIVVVTIMTTIAMRYYDDEQFKAEGYKLSNDLVKFFADWRTHQPQQLGSRGLDERTNGFF